MRTTRHSLLALLVSIGAVAATACTDEQSASDRTSVPDTDVSGGQEIDIPLETPSTTGTSVAPGNAGRRPITGLRLAPFSDCAEFLDHVKQEARDRVGPYGLDPYGYPIAWRGGDVVMSGEASATEEAAFDMAAAATVPAAAPAGRLSSEGGDDSGQAAASGEASVTGTNTQEEGVDEPDIIKADGDRIITVWENVLSYVDISSGAPVLAGTLTIPEGWGHQLFISGGRALLLTNGGSWGVPMPVDTPVVSSVAADMGGTPYGAGAIVTEIDLSDPGRLRVAATLRIEGQYLNARAIGDRVVLAVSSGPQWMPWLYPQTQAGEQRAIEANQALVDDSTLADWVPQFELSIDGGATTTGDLLGCEQLDRPAEFSGFDVISVIGLDMAAGLSAGYDSSQATGVLAGGQTVYASLDRFYVATTKWVAADAAGAVDDNGITVWSEDYQTDLHAFAINPGAPLDYVASGSVDGTLLNSFSLDEHEGYLRVLATDGTPWNRSNESETRLTVFAEDGEQLVTVGQVGGLGRGEALYSARLIGDRGFAVTFRQVDPFYVLDLSDPANPQVTGELKIPGFSTYLHPVGEHRVLGVGRNATEDGVVTGLKLSLFDVSDPASPAEISTWTLDNAQTAAEYDHHAFQMIGSTAILPVESWNDGFSGAIVFDIGDAIAEVGRISHVPADAEPTSDCRRLAEGDVPQESPLYWYSIDTSTRFQLCGADDAGGYGDWYCERVMLGETANWFGTDVTAQLTEIDQAVDRVEMCYPSGSYQFAIQRSVVIDGTLWTMSPKALWAHDLATLQPLANVMIGA